MWLEMSRLRTCSPRVIAFSERGIALLTTLILMTLLAAVGVSGTILSRVDLFIAQNLRSGTEAFWLAQAGVEVGKNWLAENLPDASLPTTLGPRALGDGTYAVKIEIQAAALYQITATGKGLNASRRVVEEVVALPPFTPLGVVTSLGDGLHPDFIDTGKNLNTSGHRIPDFSIDGRNHALDGRLSSRCADIAPFAVSQSQAQLDLVHAYTALKRHIVTRANRFCYEDGHSTVFWRMYSGARMGTGAYACAPFCSRSVYVGRTGVFPSPRLIRYPVARDSPACTYPSP